LRDLRDDATFMTNVTKGESKAFSAGAVNKCVGKMRPRLGGGRQGVRVTFISPELRGLLSFAARSNVLVMKRFTTLFACFLVAFLAGCGGSSETDAEADLLRIAVIPKGTTHVFWKSIEAGARVAETELNEAGTPVEVIWQGPLREDDRSAQINVLETFISRGVDGFVLAPLDSQALVPPVRLAGQAGIPTVIIDSGLNTEDIVSFVATDNFRGGQLGGQRLGELLGGGGKVILLRYQVGSASTEQREAGFLDAIGQFPGIEIISENQYAGATRNSALDAARSLLNRHGSEVDGIFTPNESSTNGMLLALREIRRVGGAVKFVGFDGGEQNVNALAAGDIQGLVLQDPFRMGYLGVMTMASHLAGEPVEEMVDTGAVLVTPENLEDEAIQALLNPPGVE